MNKVEPTTAKSGSVEKAEQASAVSKDVHGRIDVQMVQNVHLVWLDSNITENNDNCQNAISHLRRSVNLINTFIDGDQCIEFIESINQEKACMIISGALGQHIVPRVHGMSQVDSIFIFCGNTKRHKVWTKDWSKIKGVFTEVEPICEALKKVAQQCEHNAVSISFMATSGGVDKKKLDQLDCSFMYTQILKEILLSMKFEPENFQEFIHYCRQKFVGNDEQLNNIKRLERKYRDQTPIWWYTYECFLYPMLNRALRTKYADIIMKMGFFISDLHRHIEQLHSEQFHEHSSGNTLTVYRSQCLSKVDFDKMMNTIGGLLAFNNFLFASKDRNYSLRCAHDTLVNPDMLGILFVMTIDPTQSTTPFASITAVDYHGAQEDKVLFSMDSIFRIQDIKSIGETNRLYQVEVTLISDNDKDLRVLTKLIQEEIPGSGWYRLGKLLRKMGHFDKAEEVYQILLAQATDESAKAPLYVQLGWIKDHEGDYQEAFIFYVKALEIQQKSVPPNHLDLSASYNNIGAVHNNLGDYSKALSNYQKALEIQQQSLTPNQPDLAVSYTNIGALYGQMGEYRTALSHFEKALEIQQQLSPSTDLSLAASYNNIGVVYYYMSDYSQALSNYEKALEIKQQSLPPNHPDLGIFYNNIGEVYCKMCEYSKALSYYEKALEIQQSLPPNHPDLAVSYNNIGAVYLNMGDDSKALCNSEKALQIRQQALHPNHPDLGDSYNNIGLVYENMDDYLKAHSFYERAVENGQRSLPTNHPTLQERKKNLKRVKNKL